MIHDLHNSLFSDHHSV